MYRFIGILYEICSYDQQINEEFVVDNFIRLLRKSLESLDID